MSEDVPKIVKELDDNFRLFYGMLASLGVISDTTRCDTALELTRTYMAYQHPMFQNDKKGEDE